MTEIHELDPNADTVIILQNPLVDVDFAVEDNSSAGKLDAENSEPEGEAIPQEAIFEELVDEPNKPEDSSQKAVHYLVPSRHLRLGSSHFDKMLSGGTWKEGTPNENDGRYHIAVED